MNAITPIDTGTSGARPVWRVSDLVKWVESRKPDRTVRTGPKPRTSEKAVSA